MGRTKDFAEAIRLKMAASPDLGAAVEDELFNTEIAMKVYEARREAGLSQKTLAQRAGTHQSVISRIEDADYDGHGLRLLRRIANALNKRLGVDFYAKPNPILTRESQTFLLDWASQAQWQPTGIGEAVEVPIEQPAGDS
jgi:transcriptional regulator with XRE-family HTH domain